MDLKTLQTHFVTALLQGPNEKQDIKWIAAQPLRRAADNLNIYRQSRIGRLSKVLQATFPVCKAIVGEHYFKQLCYHYANHYQDPHPDITFYGNHFPLFLTSPEFKKQLDYLPDVARLEWACFNVLQHGEVLPLSMSALSSVAQEKHPHVKFRLGSTHCLIQSEFSILQIWQQHQEDPDFAEMTLDNSGCQILVYRRGWTLTLDVLSPVEFLFLSCFAKDLNFEETWLSCEKAFPGTEVTALFMKAVTRGWITRFITRS